MKNFRLPRKKKKRFKKSFLEAIIVPPIDAFPKHYLRLEQLESRAEYKASDFTLDNFKEALEDFFKGPDIERKQNVEQDLKFMELISPYLHMTEEEMRVAIPDGTYEISGGGLIAWTGKGGLIMNILAMQKEIKKYE